MRSNFKFGRSFKKSVYEQLNDLLTDYNRADVVFTAQQIRPEGAIHLLKNRTSGLHPTAMIDERYFARKLMRSI